MDCVLNVVGQLKAGESLAWFLLLKGALDAGRKRGQGGSGNTSEEAARKPAKRRDGLSHCGGVWW